MATERQLALYEITQKLSSKAHSKSSARTGMKRRKGKRKSGT